MAFTALRTLGNTGRALVYPLRRVGLLLRRHWMLLLVWFLIANLLHRGVIWIAAWTGVRHPLVGLMVLPSAVLVSLGTYVVMFLMLRPSLRYHRRAVEEGALADEGVLAGSDRTFLDAVTMSLLPFLTFYFLWQLLRDDAIDYASKALELANETVFDTHPLSGNVSAPLTGRDAAVTAIVSYVVRLLIKRLAARQGSVLELLRSVAVGYLECLWIFFTIYGIANAATPQQWLRDRAVIAWVRDWWGDVVNTLLGKHNAIRDVYDAVVGAIHSVSTDLWNAAILPLMWLTVVAVIYGRHLPEPEKVQAREGTRLSRAVARAGRTPGPVRFVVVAVTSDWRARWLPVSNAFRVVTHGGLLPFLGFLLAYSLVDAACGWFWIGLREVLGPHPIGWWQVVYSPVYDGVDALRIILHVCLLAAVYDRTIGGLAGYLGGTAAVTAQTPDTPAEASPT